MEKESPVAVATPAPVAPAPPAQDKQPKNEIVTMRQLLESGVHFGHQTKRWNPKMKKYIFTARNDIHVIDLQQTIKLIRVAYQFVRQTVASNGSILFVGTKKQAQEAIQTEAERAGMPYVNQRWLGGTLTNNVTIRQSINKLKRYEKLKEDGVFDQLSKKEAARRLKTLNRLRFYLNGIKNMYGLPSILFVIDTKKEQLAVNEGRKLRIPIIGIVDTNADPTEVDYPIPANDDAIRAIKLLCSIMADAVVKGQSEQAHSQSEKPSVAVVAEVAETGEREAEVALEPELDVLAAIGVDEEETVSA